jgi:GNAT superfamily N-acetyltransferase
VILRNCACLSSDWMMPPNPAADKRTAPPRRSSLAHGPRPVLTPNAAIGHAGRVELRRARRDEAGEVAGVWLRSRQASIPAIPPPAHTDEEVLAWFQEVVLPNREVWVAQSNGTVIALLVLEADWVDQLYVEPGWTGHGVGSRLLAVAQQRRPAGLKLWTFQSNAGARRFYERHGFVAKETTDGDNEEGAPDVLYEWPWPGPEVDNVP